MAFTGVLLGLFARIAYENGIIADSLGKTIDPEMGLPILLRTLLPVGLTGIVLSSYFSAIMSTADSCLMASSGNIITDILNKHKSNRIIGLSQLVTLILGIVALLIAWKIPNVLDLMLYSYSFMVSGLFIPVLVGLFAKQRSIKGVFWSMIIGGSTTLLLIIMQIKLPFDLDANIYGITLALIIYLLFHFSNKNSASTSNVHVLS
jgi:SSS family solute:Na+ symporter